jgi:hypothetical protein
MGVVEQSHAEKRPISKKLLKPKIEVPEEQGSDIIQRLT